MVGLIFILCWFALGVTIALLAMRAGQRGSGPSGEGRGATRAIAVFFALVYLAFGAAIPALVLASDDDKADKAGGVKLSAAQAHGRELFALNCAQCHTLAASSATGRVGPDLDQLRPPSSLVLNAIQQGRARGGIGQMPAELLQGKDARDVAAYVAAVAGQ